MEHPISLRHKGEIERDLKSIGYYPGIFTLNILRHKFSSNIEYTFLGVESRQEAVRTVIWTYDLCGFDEVCLYMVEPRIDQKGDYFVERWLVRVNFSGQIKDELLMVIEDFTSDPIATVMI